MKTPLSPFVPQGHPLIKNKTPEVSMELIASEEIQSVIQKIFSGFTARIFQHEVDHVNGICFPDRIGPNGSLHWIPDNQYNLYKEQWRDWSLSCPWEVWLQMKENQPYELPSSSV